jgi:hydrogenase expression/formation protein HypC
MCLGIPGTIVELPDPESFDPKVPQTAMGKVSFGGIIKEVCLAFVPEAGMGDYVIIHAGFAISQIDEKEAQEVFDWLEQIGAIEEEMNEAGINP